MDVREVGEFVNPKPLYHHDNTVFPHLERVVVGAEEDPGNLDNTDDDLEDDFARTLEIWKTFLKKTWSML